MSCRCEDIRCAEREREVLEDILIESVIVKFIIMNLRIVV
ncbi:hypothetical protein HMPREF1135_02473 [Lachnoanaerobaculum sp. OBRC5-5]|nr:hypothetical protein HMPREF1135_02473 [Lachnoanaerobaculum sp. OBRC5-5]